MTAYGYSCNIMFIMRIKPFSNFQTVIYFLFGLGIVIDTWSVYNLWAHLNDIQYINDAFLQAGVPLDDLDTESFFAPIQNTLNIVLLIFLLWDYVAYFYFLNYRNWARKYVLSIGVFYLLGNLFEFSLISTLYGIATIYYLWGARSSFTPPPIQKTTHPYDLSQK